MRSQAHRKDRRDLIETIFQYQDLDSLLRLGVVLCNLELEGDGCSLFLYEPEAGEIVLKESTVLTRFLGQRKPFRADEELELAKKVKRLLARHGLQPADLGGALPASRLESWGPELGRLLYRFGLTRWTFLFDCPLLIPDVRQDVRWSSFQAPRSPFWRRLQSGAGAQENTADVDMSHCELPHQEMRSIAVVGVGGCEPGGLPKAEIRVVRRRRRAALVAADLEWMSGLAKLLGRCMDTAISLTDLTDLGTQLEVEDFGRTLVNLLRRVVGAAGCSIFLEMTPPAGSRRTFQCIATTGLESGGRQIPKEEARYEVDTSQEETEYLTSWVLLHGQLIALSDVYNYNREDYPGLRREPHHGKFSETDAEGKKFEPAPLLISPLFLQQGREVAGAIRVVRSREQPFQPHEQLLFLDISRRLSRVLTNLSLRQVSEQLIKLYNEPDRMLERVTEEVRRLLGVEGCSVFLVEGSDLVLRATVGALKGQERKIRYFPGDPERRGWTGWVAHNKRALRLNSPQEIASFPDPPHHSEKDSKKPCEIGEPAHRFLAVPILREPEAASSEVLGVIRAPRLRVDPPFEEVHQSILVSFAVRLSLALDLAHRNEQLKAVAELPRLDYRPDDASAAIAGWDERAVRVLVEKLEFDAAAIYTLNTPAGCLELRCGWPKGDLSLPGRLAVGLGIDSPYAEALARRQERVVHAGADGEVYRLVCPVLLGNTPLGTLEVTSRSESRMNQRQRHLVQLVAGFCADALYNEAVFTKLDSLREELGTVGKEMTVSSLLEKKLEVIAAAAARVTQADNVIIHEYVGPPPEKGSSRGRFRESASGGTLKPDIWQKVDVQRDGVPYRVVLEGKAVFAEVAAESEVLFLKKDEPNFIQREGIQSVAALPLLVDKTCLGCIFFNFATHQEFDPQKRLEIQMMAEYAAIAIYQGRLLEETSKLSQEKTNLLLYAEHSLNQPLTALRGFLSSLAGGFSHREIECHHLTSKEAFRGSLLARNAESQHRLCEYLCYLVDTFLRIDRLETLLREAGGGDQIDQELFNVQPLAEQNLSQVCTHAVDIAEAYGQSAILRNIPPDVTGEFDGNSIQISLLNVLVNAIKHGRHADASGLKDIRLTLRTSGEGATEWAEILVEDSGPGVPAGEVQHIFEKNYTRGGSTPGLGIGLFLTRGYIEAHHGVIEVRRSAALGGACFAIRLPLSGREAQR
jgi:signal transduction histidine kinase